MKVSPLSNVTGFIFIALGLVSIAYPAYASVGLESFFGAMFLVGGIFHTFGTYEARDRSDYVWNLGVGILYILIGVCLLGNPKMGLFALTYFLILLFLTQGGLQLLVGLRQREMSEKWYWTILVGLSNLAIGVILFLYFPISVVFALGLLVGLNLFMLGFSILLVNRIIGKE